MPQNSSPEFLFVQLCWGLNGAWLETLSVAKKRERDQTTCWILLENGIFKEHGWQLHAKNREKIQDRQRSTERGYKLSIMNLKPYLGSRLATGNSPMSLPHDHSSPFVCLFSSLLRQKGQKSQQAMKGKVLGCKLRHQVLSFGVGDTWNWRQDLGSRSLLQHSPTLFYLSFLSQDRLRIRTPHSKP